MPRSAQNRSSSSRYLSTPSATIQFWGRGSGGVKSTIVSQSVRGTSRDESGVFPHQKISSKQGIWSSQFLRDLSQVVGRTPGDAHVNLYLYFPWPKIVNFQCPRDNGLLFQSSGGSPSEGHNPQRGSPRKYLTPNMTGRRFHRAMEMIPARPW